MSFDSTSFKESSVLAEQLGAMRELGESGLVRAGKDISNPGLLGTLAMLLETSKVGAVVDVDAIVVPEGLTLAGWLQMYPGMGFVVTTRPAVTPSRPYSRRNSSVTAATCTPSTWRSARPVRQPAWASPCSSTPG